MSAVAEQLDGSDIEIFSRESLARGAREWTADVVSPPAPYRLYRATATEMSILAPPGDPDYALPGDNRVVVTL